MAGRDVPIVHDRYHDDFAQWLALFGFAIDNRPQASQWHERALIDPPRGRVRIRGRRLTEEGWEVVVALDEYWVLGDEGVHRRRGCAVVAYEYYAAISPFDLEVGYALDSSKPEDLRFHWHPPGQPPIARRPAPCVEPPQALKAAEQLVFDARRFAAQVQAGKSRWEDCLDYSDYLSEEP